MSVERDGIRIPVTVIVEMTGEQVKARAAEYGLPKDGGPLLARHMVADMRGDVYTMVRDSLGKDATVTLK